MDYKLLVYLGIILLIIAILQYLTKSKDKNTNTDNNNQNNTTQTDTNQEQQYPYIKKYILTKTEYNFYKTLKNICDAYDLIICPKVRLEDFISVKGTTEISKYRGYIKSRHVDFLICDNQLYVKAALELDDKSHNRESVQKKDEFKNKLFETINVKLYRIKTDPENYKAEISKMIAEITNP